MATIDPLVALVEDEPVVRDLTACELADLGFKVIEFESADAALPWLERHGQELSVVVTDVQMPGTLNGLQLVEILTARFPRLAILVTSGGPLVDPGKLPSCARFVAKPWRPVDLAARVKRMAAA